MTLFNFIEDSTDTFYTLPDTVICREAHKSGVEFDYYLPDGIKNLVAVPFVYIRINRPCKSLLSEFACRHYNSCGYGIHLISSDTDEGSILDGSVFLSPPTDIVTETCSPDAKSEKYEGFEGFDDAIARASRYITLRVGDLIVLDLPQIATITTETIHSPEQIYIEEYSTKSINYQDLTINIKA